MPRACCRLIRMLLLALPGVCGVFAQPSRFQPYFEEFTLPGGEAANMVQCIIQDRTGFLWFASRNGLIRYDGRQFIAYRNNPLDSSSIASDYINWIFEDSRGKLWLGHVNDGLSLFDPVSEKSVRYRHLDDDPNSLAANYVSRVVEDRRGMLWVATAGGLDRIEPPSGKAPHGRIKHYPLPSRLPRVGDKGFARALLTDKNGTLWAGCGNPYGPSDEGEGLYRYYPEKDAFIPCLLPPGSLEDNRIQVLFEDSRDSLWVGTCGKNGLYRMETRGQQLEYLRKGGPALRYNDHVFPMFEHMTFIFEDQQSRLWMGAVEGGLDVYDPASRKTEHFEKVAGKPGKLPVISLWHGCQARDGSIWLACGDNGPVFRVHNTNNLFPFYDLRPVLGTDECAVTGIAEDPNGILWLQVIGDFTGVLRFDRENNLFQRYTYEPAVQRLTYFDLFDLSIDRQNKLWAGTETGLYFLDPAEKGNRTFRPDQRFAPRMLPGPVWPPYTDRRGQVWIPTYGNGLYRFDPGKEEPVRYMHREEDALSLGNNLVEGVFEDSQGQLWVCGSSNGMDGRYPMFLDRFRPGRSPQQDIFEHFIPPGIIGELEKVVEERNGCFWYSAFPYGIRKFDPKTRQLQYFTVNNSSLPANAITEMLPGADGNIWMFSKGRIIRLDPQKESFFGYSAFHGVHDSPHPQPWLSGACSGKNGELFFGGAGGFHAFDPRDIRKDIKKYPAALVITDLKVLGKRVVPGETPILERPVWERDAIRLPHQQNVFALQVSSFEYGGPKWSKLEYILENYDRDWRSDLRDGEAAYVNVPPGKYVFRVRGENSLGNTLQECQLRVIILPPWWQTWWARTFFALLVLSALYGLYRFQLGRKLEHAEAIRLRELDIVKTRLYTNVTHEFRTPLTLLIGPVERILREKVLDDEIRKVLLAVQRNSGRLLNLVNQMLDLAKLESGKIALHPVLGDMVAYLRYVVESFHSVAEEKHIRIHFLSALESLTMDFDEERMRQIAANLLSNALKFTPENGDIYIDLQLEKTATGSSQLSETAVLRLRDTGIGIPEDQLPYIFDRFYQVDDTHTRPGEGTGIGLALTRELVRLMGGEIQVQSRPGWGTEFMVMLPVTRTAETKPSAQTAIPEPWSGRDLSDTASPIAPQVPSVNTGAPLILLVEDNTDVIAYLASCLPDYLLATARDGQEGLEIAFEITPDIVISDVMMPRMDGFQLCRALKNDSRTSHIPIILLTAKADHSSKMEGLEHGAEAYLTKPFQQEELQLRVRKLLENREILQAHYLNAAGLTEGAIILKDIPALNGFDHAFVQQVRSEVEAHLNDAGFDVERLCRKLAMSRSQVHRKLSALTGLSALNFIRYVRLNKAKELLQNPALSIISIAFDCGFNDPAYFSRVFKQEFGITPQAWRERQSSP